MSAPVMQKFHSTRPTFAATRWS